MSTLPPPAGSAPMSEMQRFTLGPLHDAREPRRELRAARAARCPGRPRPRRTGTRQASPQPNDVAVEVRARAPSSRSSQRVHPAICSAARFKRSPSSARPSRGPQPSISNDRPGHALVDRVELVLDHAHGRGPRRDAGRSGFCGILVLEVLADDRSSRRSWSARRSAPAPRPRGLARSNSDSAPPVPIAGVCAARRGSLLEQHDLHLLGVGRAGARTA